MKCITLASVILLFLAVNGVQSLKCYTCWSNAADPDSTCENDALNVPLVDCSPQMVYCLTMITGSTLENVNSTLRTCTDQQLYTNGLHEFENITISYQTCQRDGCNVAPSVRAGVPVALLVIASALWTV